MPFDRPKKEELVTAVREFLETKLLPELEGHTSFNSRIAINVLKILERELEQGESISQPAKQRLLSLLKNPNDKNIDELNKALSQEIEAGILTYKDQSLLDHLWETTMGKLSVDNPRYASYQQELQNS